MQSKAASVEEYLQELPQDRREPITKVRETILKSLPEGYKETVQYGMISYVVPLERYPDGYLSDKKTPLPYISLASQKNHMAVYLINIYSSPQNYEWFTTEYKKSGKKMDIGKSCVRFKKLENLPLELIGEAVAKTSVEEFITLYEQAKKK